MKLLNTNIIKLYTTKDYSFINKYVFLKEEKNNLKKKYDIALVLGCSNYSIMFKRSDAAIELYKKKIINKIYLTGGIGVFSKNRKEPESLIMKKYMISKGIKEEDIITETNTKDTVGNMKETLKMIDENYNKKLNILLITSSFHMKRAKMLLENMCNHNIYSYSIKDGIGDKDIWNTSKIGKNLIKNEAALLYFAAKKGIIKNIEI